MMRRWTRSASMPRCAPSDRLQLALSGRAILRGSPAAGRGRVRLESVPPAGPDHVGLRIGRRSAPSATCHPGRDEARRAMRGAPRHAGRGRRAGRDRRGRKPGGAPDERSLRSLAASSRVSHLPGLSRRRTGFDAVHLAGGERLRHLPRRHRSRRRSSGVRRPDRGRPTCALPISCTPPRQPSASRGTRSSARRATSPRARPGCGCGAPRCASA